MRRRHAQDRLDAKWRNWLQRELEAHGLTASARPIRPSPASPKMSFSTIAAPIPRKRPVRFPARQEAAVQN